MTQENCAYLRAAAMSICLYIPIQRNRTRFSFSALAPSYPSPSFTAVGTVNADKRYPPRRLLRLVTSEENSIYGKVMVFNQYLQVFCYFFAFMARFK